MKRTALKRSRVAIKRRSKKTAAAYAGKDGRRAFVKGYLKAWPVCQVNWEGCTAWTQDVHEWWSRGTGGAIVPGPKADIQGQQFIPVCRHCHDQLQLQPDRAKEEGWVRRVGKPTRYPAASSRGL